MWRVSSMNSARVRESSAKEPRIELVGVGAFPTTDTRVWQYRKADGAVGLLGKPWVGLDQRVGLDGLKARAGAARLHPRKAVGIGITGDQARARCKTLRERQGLATGTGAEIDDTACGLGADQQGGDLRALVLHFDQSVTVGVEAGDVGAAGNAHADG